MTETLLSVLFVLGGFVAFILLIILIRAFRVLNEYERGVIFVAPLYFVFTNTIYYG